MSWEIFYRCVCDANFFFDYLVKLDRMSATSAVVSVHPWQIVNDQLANQNARFIRVML